MANRMTLLKKVASTACVLLGLFYVTYSIYIQRADIVDQLEYYGEFPARAVGLLVLVLLAAAVIIAYPRLSPWWQRIVILQAVAVPAVWATLFSLQAGYYAFNFFMFEYRYDLLSDVSIKMLLPDVIVFSFFALVAAFWWFEFYNVVRSGKMRSLSLWAHWLERRKKFRESNDSRE